MDILSLMLASKSVNNKAKLYKLYFDGADIYRTYQDWENGNDPMTFQEIYDLCYDAKNFVYIGDGQMKYYPQLDLNVPSLPESITFISTLQLDGKNGHTRIIINENNEVKTNQIIDMPLSNILKIGNTEITESQLQALLDLI